MSAQPRDKDLITGPDFNINALNDAAQLLFKIWRDHRPEFSLAECRRELQASPSLYNTLKTAFRSQGYEKIRNWGLTSTFAASDHLVDQEVLTFLNDLQPRFVKFVESPSRTFKAWSPKIQPLDASTSEFLAALAMPSIIDRPNMLLHDLGRFQQDPQLRQRVGAVFKTGEHTVLVNGSGSGKTRLLFEGLSNHWGLYFTSVIDSSRLGSYDVGQGIDCDLAACTRFSCTLPSSSSTKYHSLLRSNQEIASDVFSRVLLARLLVFDLFLGAAQQAHGEWHIQTLKYRWLLLQLFPGAIRPGDLYFTLRTKLQQASQRYINEKINTTLLSVRRALSRSQHTAPPFFCALDEAQYAASQHTSAFRCDESINTPSSILQEIVRNWEQHFTGHGVYMVIAGVEIPKASLSHSQNSRFRWLSNTGAFDNLETQRNYVMRYLPESFAQSSTGKRLVERMWYWLRGRHRFTAAFVSVLIEHGFKRPHGLLNVYVQKATQLRPTDADEIVQDEEAREGDHRLTVSFSYGLGFHKLRKDGLFDEIYQMAVGYLLRKTIAPKITRHTVRYVGAGVALFEGTDVSTAIMYEPTIILSILQWTENHTTIPKLLMSECSSPHRSLEILENLVMYSIFRFICQRRPLDEVFSFGKPIPKWAREGATIIALHRTVVGGVGTGVLKLAEAAGRLEPREDARPSIALGVNVASPDALFHWLTHSAAEPFCFPRQCGMGPSIMFALKLSDGSFIWVAVEVAVSEADVLSSSRAREAIRRVTPSQFFMNKDGTTLTVSTEATSQTHSHLLQLPGRRLKNAGKYSLLRVIATPTEIDLNSYLADDPDNQHHPIAYFNMQLFEKLDKKAGEKLDEQLSDSETDEDQALLFPPLKRPRKNIRAPTLKKNKRSQRLRA